MATLKQTRANRLNAQKCNGPSSAEGKARSSSNALKSGIQAESEILPWEDPAERAVLRDEYHICHQPRTPEERSLVDSLAHGEFVLRRLRRVEVKIVISKIPDEADLPEGTDLNDDAVIGQSYIDASGELGRLQRRMDATNRAFHRDLDQLRLLEAERPPFDPPPPLILVPSQPEPPPSDPPAPSTEPADEAQPATPPDPPAPAAEPAAPDPDPAAPDPDPPAPPAAPADEVPAAAPPDPPTPAAEAAAEPGCPAPAADSPDPQSPAPVLQPPAPAPPAPAPQPPVVVLVGLNRILSELSKNLTPTQIATLTLSQAAALRKSPAPEPVDPDLSTIQPTESTAQTQQMVSFGEKPEIAPEPAPTPAPEKPRGFNPKNPHHPPIEMCPSCNSMGTIHDRCYFQPRGWPRT